MRYKVLARCRVIDGFMFMVFADGCREAVRTAITQLGDLHKETTFKPEKCTRKESIIIGEDHTGDMTMRVFVTPFPEE